MTKNILPKTPKICIIGPGVVGKATGIGFLKKNIPVTFVGINEKKIEKLREEGYDAYTQEEMEHKEYDFDISMLAVPTPTENGSCNLDFIKKASIHLGKRLKKTSEYHVVAVKSTVPPGTTRNIAAKLVAEYSNKSLGEDFGLCMNPEYLREVSSVEDCINPWIITIGELDKKSGDALSRVYKDFSCPQYRVSIEEAETQKYVHNLFNAVKIAYFNEMREICNNAGVNPDTIFPLVGQSCEGMWNPKYGIKDLGPFDGECLPKDTQSFLAWAKDKGFDMPLLETTILTNNVLKQKTHIRKVIARVKREKTQVVLTADGQPQFLQDSSQEVYTKE